MQQRKRNRKQRMKDEGGRMKGMLLRLESFYFILHPSAFILCFSCAGVRVKISSSPGVSLLAKIK
jgi:hypothetical protein